MLKTETVAPMPSASDRIAVSAKPGCLLIWRSAKRRSCRMVGIGWTDNFGDKWSGREDRTSDPLAPNSRTERSPSDIEGVIPRLNVHARSRLFSLHRTTSNNIKRLEYGW